MKSKVLILGYSFLVFSLKNNSISVKRIHLVAAVNTPMLTLEYSYLFFFFVKLRGFQCLAFLLIPHIPTLPSSPPALQCFAFVGIWVLHQTVVKIVKQKQEH